MEIELAIPQGQQVIEKYEEGRFMVSGKYHEGSILIRPDETRSWDVASFEEISEDSLQPFIGLAEEIEVLLLGCGAQFEFVTPAFRQALRDKGLVVEAMDTGAACRTYNVLLSEGRRVAAALIAID